MQHKSIPSPFGYTIDDDGVVTLRHHQQRWAENGVMDVGFEMSPQYVLDMAEAVRERLRTHPDLMSEQYEMSRIPLKAESRLIRDPDGVTRATLTYTPVDDDTPPGPKRKETQ